jgi:hypothetical protein
LKPSEKGVGRSLRGTLSAYFPKTPVPLTKPAIVDDFHGLSVLGRVTESIKYNISCFEYSISPKGGLRQWIKINISLLLLFGIPILIFVPLLTYLLSGFVTMSEFLANMTGSLLEAARNFLYFLCTLIAIASIIFIVFALYAKGTGRKFGDRLFYQSQLVNVALEQVTANNNCSNRVTDYQSDDQRTFELPYLQANPRIPERSTAKPDIQFSLNSPGERFVIDGLNVCFGYMPEGSPPSLCALLSLLLALLEMRCSFLCIFDASARHKEFTESRVHDAKGSYKHLLSHHPACFMEAPGGTQADDFVLLIASENGQRVISNDRYRDKAKVHSWIVDSPERLIKGNGNGSQILIPPIGLVAQVNSDLPALVEELDIKLNGSGNL